MNPNNREVIVVGAGRVGAVIACVPFLKMVFPS